MKQIASKEYEKYQQHLTDKLHSRLLTPNGLCVVFADLDNDPEKIGIRIHEKPSACVPPPRSGGNK